MNVRTSITRAGAFALASLTMLAVSAAPASAHYLDIDPPGGEPKTKWVGGPLFDEAKGKGLIPGGPGGAFFMTPAHGNGLNSACAALRANGNGVVDIYGPPLQSDLPDGVISGCRHGEVVMEPED